MNDTQLSSQSSHRTDAVQRLADMFLSARHTRQPIEQTPSDLVPPDRDAAYAIQDAVVTALTPELGPIGGWKVGAQTVTAEPFCSPIHQATIYGDNVTVPAEMFAHPGVEAEIAYRFGQALPPRNLPYTEGEVLGAIASAHAAIEIYDTRFAKPHSQDWLAHLADQGSHGAMMIGPAMPSWQSLVPVEQDVVEIINGETVFSHKGGNSAGDTRRLLVWLANEASRRGYGIAAGAVVISGSTTGTTFVGSKSNITVRFPGFSEVSVFLA